MGKSQTFIERIKAFIIKNVLVCLFTTISLISLTTVVGFLTRNTQTYSEVEQSYLRVKVVDLNGNGIHNAKVTVCEQNVSFFTDNNGFSPQISIVTMPNGIDATVTDWFCVTVLIQKENYVNTVVFNCVLYSNEERGLTVKVYEKDESSLDFVCYVENPPQSYIEQLFEKRNE